MSKNLLNEEIIRIQEMMGVQQRELTLISEQWAAIGRLFGAIPAFRNSVAKGIVKELIPGMTTFGAAIKNQLDDAVGALLVAARAGDEAGALTALKVITNLDEVGEGISKGIATKMVDDISTGSIRTTLDDLAKRAKEMNPNLTDDEVVKLLNNQIDEVFGEFPTLAGQLKSQLTPVIEWSGKGVKKVVITTDQIMNKLKLMNPSGFDSVMSEFPKFASNLRTTLSTMIDSGAKSLDELEEIAMAELKKKMKPTKWKRVSNFMKETFGNQKGGLNKKAWYSILALSIVSAGGIPGTYQFIKDLFFPDKDDKSVKEHLEDLDKTLDPRGDDDSNDNNNVTPTNCPGKAEFEKFSMDTFGVAPDSFDENNCSGLIAGTEFKWGGNGWE